MPHTFTLVQKVQLIDKVFFVTFKSETDIQFRPGQFMSLEVSPKTFRAYSVCYVGRSLPPVADGESLLEEESNRFVSFMISTKPGGLASEYFDNVQVGNTLNAVGPSGKFSLLKDDSRNSVFIATGTGLSPFVTMVDSLLSENDTSTVTVFFGCWKISDNFANRFFKNPRVKLIVVAEDIGDQVESDTLKVGRVTTAIPELLSDMKSNTYYLCGHPAMVQDMETVLLKNGVDTGQIISEKFGIIKK